MKRDKYFNFIFTECIRKEQGIQSFVNGRQELGNLADEFKCQEACQKQKNCSLFYWKNDTSKCYWFSSLLEDEKSIVNETSSVIGQPDCQNLIPNWPNNLVKRSPQTRFVKCYIYLDSTMTSCPNNNTGS